MSPSKIMRLETIVVRLNAIIANQRDEIRRLQWALHNERNPPALAAGSRRAKTPKAVECKASQSGPKGNAR